MAGKAARGVADEELSAASGAAGVHTEGEREAETPRHTHDQGQGGANGRAVDSGTDFRVGLSGLFVWFPTGEECAPGAGGDSRAFASGSASGVQIGRASCR